MSDLDQPATKRDLIEWRQEVRHDLERLKLETKADLAELKLATKADLAELKVDLLKWGIGLNLGTLVAMTGIFTAIVAWLR